MKISDIPFAVTDWTPVERVEHKAETGTSYGRTPNFGPIRVRIVEYTAGYLTDHCSRKGHVLLCLEGQLETELKDGGKFMVRPGLSYQVGDDKQPHRSSTATAAKLFIVD